ncbi:DNA polymerase III subunit delta [Pseudohalocynthiibacter aestuariivivens]|jgi:DNA polymerase III subunit delta|uniref:DNA-directed DNA polymerase n=1 Tax=Pseudohalocynthiibacter aestuariivivens TaxID=1591409 RepID=A0ABV5JDR2_9RHOB|nr:MULTISPECIES: DNA polymerase III subunit delta [Pseudohalocynthiibacter]MBS9718017.1 DNA polymerase III subunit delta [Pseudohalocynthiibacter aestuariivivens]MCK0103189.1 DNA polymerase III subunit delta [Pseudohalocynthiibacter sp. F2068]
MKLTGRDANQYFAKPDPNRTGLLIYGADAMRVALKRQEVIAALIGPNGDEEMRLSRIPGAELRKDPALLLDAVKAQSFFPGPRVAFVEDAGDANAPQISMAFADWQTGDAQIIVTARQITARSALRKLFESHNNAFAVGIYDDPPSRDEIEATLKRAGVQDLDRDAMGALEALSRSVDPGDFRQTVEKLGLYKLGDTSPVTPEDVAAVAPTSTEAALDDVLNIVAEARTPEIGPIMARLVSQGTQPVGLCIGATRHFRQLYVAASDPGGPAAGIGRLRPPVFGARRDRMLRQAQGWGMYKLEQALTMLTDTDLQLRSTSQAPAMALMERTLIRLSMLARR